MFGLRKEKNSCEQEARAVYKIILQRALEPVFYSDYGVPDSFEGRFDLLSLHMFAVMHVLLSDSEGELFNQALFDVMFADMDQALREGGKGDMGVPKQMRLMMKAFNGRMNRYEESIGKVKTFEQALNDNLYGSADVSAKTVKSMQQYTKALIKAMKEQGTETIKAGKLRLPKIEG